MFGWLFGWLMPRRNLSGYTQGQRDIFPYWDGRRERRGDPLAVDRALQTDPAFDFKLDPQISQVPTLDGVKATGRVVAATRRAFGIKPLEEGGLTDVECLGLFCDFNVYIRHLEDQARPLASSPGPTASAAGTDSATPNSAASGSTASA
jgi:hypothetical protein